MIYRLYFSSEIVIRGRRKTEIIRTENFEKEEAGAAGDHGGDVVNSKYENLGERNCKLMMTEVK